MAGSRRSLPADARGPRDASAGAAPPAADSTIDDGDASCAGHDVRAAVALALGQALPGGGRVGVALSGGRDSMVLLDALNAIKASAHATIVGLHVHHGLSRNADAWAEFCRAACSERGIAFALRCVNVVPAPRESLEAAARAARYAALEALADEERVNAVLLAHHADDQAETLLLQLLRGAGVPGLAAMPPVRMSNGRAWLRPFLALPRRQLEAFAQARGLRYVDDESNLDTRYRRNALRARVTPALQAIAPGYPVTLARAARHQAEAAALLDDLARLDAGSGWNETSLDARALRALGPPRARNLLRWFLARHGLRPPSSARLDEMLRQLLDASPDARVALHHAGVDVGIHRGRIAVHSPAPAAYHARWSGAAQIDLPHGTLQFRPTHGRGIASRHLAASVVTIRAGVRGERLQLAGRYVRRGVTDLLREAGVPHWDRASLPRLYCDEALAAVASLGTDAAFAAAPDEAAYVLEWHPAADTCAGSAYHRMHGKI
jgi:tRNA(Ile)-lysidine synthase